MINTQNTKRLLKINTQKIEISVEKWAKGMNKQFKQCKIRMVNKDM